MIHLWILLILVPLSFAKDQAITVNGTLLCGKNRVKNAVIYLMEEDKGFFDEDDELARITVTNGDFIINGTENEFLEITPYLRIEHKCNSPTCTRITRYEIPSKFINGATYDMNMVALDIERHDEKCQ